MWLTLTGACFVAGTVPSSLHVLTQSLPQRFEIGIVIPFQTWEIETKKCKVPWYRKEYNYLSRMLCFAYFQIKMYIACFF